MIKKRILIYGAGATGIFIGTKLQNAGFEVYLHGRNKLNIFEDYVKLNNSKYILPKKDDELVKEHFDFIFVTTKLYDLENALKEIKEYNLSYDVIVLSQNGIIEDNMLKSLDKNKLCNMIIFEGYSIDPLHKSILAQKNTKGWQLDNNINSNKVKYILNKARIVAKINSKFSSIKAEKMIVNCAISAICLIRNKNIGEVLRNKEDRQKVISMIHEAYEVLSKRYPLRSVKDIKKDILVYLEENGDHYPSLYQDFIQDKKCEIDYFNGQLIKWAKKENIKVNINEHIYADALKLIRS